MAERTRKELILDTLEDSMTNFLYYDRKEDEELPCGDIEAAIKSGEITVEELVSKFEFCLREGLT